MPYMLLVIEDAEQRRTRPRDVGRAAYERMQRFTDDLGRRGLLRAADALTTDAVRVTARGGKRAVVDGPFAESKELVGGYFLLDCATRDDAVAIAAECPATAWATVEVRQVGTCWEAAG